MSYEFGRLNELADRASEVSESRGWTVPDWNDVNGVLAKLMLVCTEVSEAAEAVRNGDQTNYAEELADIVIRVFHMANSHGVNLEQEIVNKIEKNRERPMYHGGKRA